MSSLSSEWRYQGNVLGHLDWVTCLSFLDLEEGGWMLASGSQDARIRLWRIHPPAPIDDDDDDNVVVGSNSAGGEQDPFLQQDDSEEEEEDDEDDEEDGDAARMHIRFSCGNGGSAGSLYESGVTLEALLIGHEEMITAVQWRPQSSSSPCLISSSMDRSILLWTEEIITEPTTDDSGGSGAVGGGGTSSTNNGLGNVWVPITRVGTAGGILGGSIGSSLLGFVNVVWNGDGTSIVGHGYGGSIHLWSSSNAGGGEADNGGGDDVVERWRAEPCLTGHFRGVTDIDWEITSGRYLLSVGMDQTCRLWSLLPPMQILTPEYNNHLSNTDNTLSRIWREIGRPQVHGYDLTSVACTDTHHRKYRFVSGAEEKEGRTFEAPLSTIRLLNTLDHYGTTTTTTKTPEPSSSKAATTSEYDDGSRVERAYIPSLGLSNRATAADAMEEGGCDTIVRTGASASADTTINPAVADGRTTTVSSSSLSVEGLIDTLPTERDLGVTTLWPELRKLFGHSTELICLTSVITTRDDVEDGEKEETKEEVVLVASSCKARDMEHASIRIWDVNRGMCVDVLKVSMDTYTDHSIFWIVKGLSSGISKSLKNHISHPI